MHRAQPCTGFRASWKNEPDSVAVDAEPLQATVIWAHYLSLAIS